MKIMTNFNLTEYTSKIGYRAKNILPFALLNCDKRSGLASLQLNWCKATMKTLQRENEDVLYC